MAAEEIKELCDANHIEARLSAMPGRRNRNLYGRRRLICTTAEVQNAPVGDIPVVHGGMPLFPAWVL